MTHTRTTERTLQLAQRALDAATNIAGAYGDARRVLWRLEEVQLHSNARGDIYAGGREREPECGVVALGNWNEVTVWADGQSKVATHGDLPVRLCKVFESLGISCEWADTHDTCCECGKLLRTDPDSWGWRPHFHSTDDGLVCFDCEPEHKNLNTIRWLRDNNACLSGKSFVGDRTLAEAVMDEDATDEHLEWVWDRLDLSGFERTREILRKKCEEEGI